MKGLPLSVSRNFGLEMKNWCICKKKCLVLQAMIPSSLQEPTILEMVYEVLKYLETYQRENKHSQMPVILCDDFNGSKCGHVHKLLRSQGFVSFYDIAYEYTDSDKDAH